MPEAPEGEGLSRLLAVMEVLRDPEVGCPWDIAQDFRSIAPYTIEEAYEVADAIEAGDWDGLEGELGDLLLQVVYHARMGAEAGRFDFHSVAGRIADKMVARHPHVFGAESREKSPAQQAADWETLKAEERGGGALDGVAAALPALTRAAKLQNRAARVGFDWGEVDPVLAKIGEEAGELAAARGGDPAALSEEYGDLLFAVVNLGRHLGLDPETALRGANAKFARRFAGVETRLAERGRGPAESDLAEMDALWEAVKRAERGGSA